MNALSKALAGTLALVGLWALATRDTTPVRAAAKTSTRTPAPIAALVDKHIDAKLAEAKVPPSAQADDAEFLRRVTLDITGRIPTAERTLAFLDDKGPDKRAKLIDELLADPEYGEHFGTIWYHRMVKPDDDNRFLISDKLQDWLAEQFNKNRGWDQVVTDILTASGDRDTHPQTVFWFANAGDKKGQPEPSKVTGAASRLFLGIRLECAECHNHPFTRLTQEDFWGVAAFFTQTHADQATKKDAKAGVSPDIREGGPAAKGGKKDQTEKASPGSIVIPDTKGKTVKATFLGGNIAALSGKTQYRPVLAAWLTSQKNPYFARAAVNKMWANFFGRGLVDPIDDMRPEAKCSHPELLKALTDEFIASGFDLKHLIRCICLSNAYQRSSTPLSANKESDDNLYAKMPVKVMSADMLYDSLQVALGHAVANNERGKGMKKKLTGGPREQFRKFFHAEVDDDVGVVEDYTHGVPQALRLLNAKQINDTTGTVAKYVKAGGGPDKIIESLYLTAVARKPSVVELKRLKAYVAEDADKNKAYGDILWALLNSAEFLFNH